MSINRFKSSRIACRLTQKEAAAALEIGQSFLSKLERSDKIANLELLSRIARLYGVTETYLLGHQAPEHRPEAKAAIDDYTPPGLRALATDRAMIEALGIESEEWRVLRSIDMPAVSKGGYVQLLSTIRGIRDQNAGYEKRGHTSASAKRQSEKSEESEENKDSVTKT